MSENSEYDEIYDQLQAALQREAWLASRVNTLERAVKQLQSRPTPSTEEAPSGNSIGSLYGTLDSQLGGILPREPYKAD